MPRPTSVSELRDTLTSEQKSWLVAEYSRLLKECEGVQDALGYVGDIIEDFTDKWDDHADNWDLLRDLIVTELKAHK